MGRPLSVLLVETQPGTGKGSMARYAQLVEKALTEQGREIHSMHLMRLRLGLKSRVISRLPTAMATWLNHLWLYLIGRQRIRTSGTDIVHILDGSYAYLLNGLNDVKAVTTVHDLIPLLQQCGRLHDSPVSWLAGWLIRRSVSGLHQDITVIAASSQTAADLAAFVGLSLDNVEIAPPALDPSLFKANNTGPDDTSAIGPSNRAYILHVGNNAHYKNRLGVLRIFECVQRQHGVGLVMAGAPPSSAMVSFVKTHVLEDQVQFVVNPEDAELVELYANASLLLFPSLYEGFGWPPLEAMACGCPVVCSSEGSLPEVAGGAALMRPAADEEGLADQCLSVLKDPELARSMRDKGREWVRQFSLERMRDDLLRAYTTALAQDGKGVPEELRQSA